jgi:hypothetical protein
MLDRLREWLYHDWPLWLEIVVGIALFVVMAGVSLFVTGWAIVRLPADYFVGPHPPPFWGNRSPLVRVVGIVGKNLLGVVLVVLGVLLSLPGVPGQGVLTILLGIMLIDLPGKRRLEKWLVSRPNVLRFVNRLRARYGQPPLKLATDEHR